MHRLVTFMLADVAVVPNVPSKSAKTRTVPPQIQFKTLNTLQHGANPGHPGKSGSGGNPIHTPTEKMPFFSLAEPSQCCMLHLSYKVLFFCLNAAVQLVIVFSQAAR